IQQSLLALAEISGNRLLSLDPQALDACSELKGTCVAIDITDLDIQIFCHPGDWGIRLSHQAPPREVDASISGRLMALVNLATQEDKLSTSIQESVRFNGNIALAQKLQKIVASLDIDWEEALSRYTGDIAAVQIHQGMRGLGRWMRNSADSLLQTSSEYLREESQLSPTRTEFENFENEVTALKNDLARSEARLQQILSKLQTD
ncbi:MAG: SCP2 sterol-binding domain-containing protein, partial [Pseudomonadota bacterium]